ncbi:MAG TPA: hypothetical protein VE934_17895 [Polaromonas sp.]|uniref:hypothetical protein n=1 Tax=Polaromonas sp. TaxID=1869339 RepID=UPI002D22CE72|nr:hypothetical protein [Polaromonas sp.]HYW58828.1 hypothetical protein [Polaromonas sp.]
MAFDFDRDTPTDNNIDTDIHAGIETQVAEMTAPVGENDFDAQCLRILRCTARAMAASPGGLRYRPGARPWLDGLPDADMLATPQRRLGQANYSTARD